MNGTNGHHNGEHNKAITSPEAQAALKTLMPNTNLSRGDIDKVLLPQVKKNLSAFLDTPERTQALITVLMEVAADKRSPHRVRAAQAMLEGIGRAIDQQLRMAEFLDKRERLDTGQATENLGGVTVVISEATPPVDRIGMED